MKNKGIQLSLVNMLRSIHKAFKEAVSEVKDWSYMPSNMSRAADTWSWWYKDAQVILNTEKGGFTPLKLPQQYHVFIDVLNFREEQLGLKPTLDLRLEG